MPFAGEIVEKLARLIAQLARPAAGLEAGGAARGDAHRMIGRAAAGGFVTLDLDSRQITNRSHNLTFPPCDGLRARASTCTNDQ